MLGAHIFAPVVVDPNDAARIYASNGNMHVSDDGGDTWRFLKIGDGGDPGIIGLGISRSDPRVLYAHNRAGEVYRTVDRAKSWTKVNELAEAPLSGVMAVDPMDADTVYIVTAGDGQRTTQVLKSTDGGRTVTAVLERDLIHTVLIDPTDSATLYVASCDGLDKSTDAGDSWTLVHEVGYPFESALALSDSDPNLLLGGDTDGNIYKSTNGGVDWTRVSTVKLHNSRNFAIAIDHTDADRVYVGEEGGFLKSLDGGVTWESINNGVVDDDAFTMAVDPENSDRVYVGNFWTRGVFLTEDGGESWELLDEWRHTPVPDHYPMEIVIDPADTNEIYISGEYGLKRSRDGGRTWTPLGEGLFHGKHVHGLDIHPTDTDVLYVGSGKGEIELSGAHVFKTTDGGDSWVDITNGFPTEAEANVYAIAIAESDPETLYVGTNAHEFVGSHTPAAGVGLYKTENGGERWEAVGNGVVDDNVFAVAVDPTDADIVYVGTGHDHARNDGTKHGGGLYKSDDGGETWTSFEQLPHGDVSHVEIHPQNSDIVLVSFGENTCGGCRVMPEGHGIYATVDGGEHWYFVSDGFTDRQQVVLDAVFDATGDVIYSGTSDGIFIGELTLEPPDG